MSIAALAGGAGPREHAAAMASAARRALGAVLAGTFACAPEGSATSGLSAGMTLSPTISSISAAEVTAALGGSTGEPSCMSDEQCEMGHVCTGMSRVCLPPGECVLAGDCAPGEGCVDGSCVTDDPCALPELARGPAPARLMILLYRGESMAETFPGAQLRRWDAVKAAVNEFALAGGEGLQLGLATYSACAPGGCSPGQVLVSPGPGGGKATIDALAGTIGLPSPDGATPDGDGVRYLCGSGQQEVSLGASLQVLAQVPALGDDGFARAVVVITDSPEQAECTAGGAVTGAGLSASLRAQGVRVFAVGFGEVGYEELTGVAGAGGTGAPRLVASPPALAAALAEVRGALTQCTFRLDQPLADVAALRVFVGDDPAGVKQDPADGWTYDAGTRMLWLTGAPCAALQTGVVDLDLRVGCDAPADG